MVMRRYKSYLKKGLKLQLVVIPEIGYRCQTCDKLCASKQNLIHHYLNAHIATKDYTCIKCKKKFRRNDNRIRHEKYCSQTNKLKRKIAPECEQSNKKLKLHHSDNYTGYGLNFFF
jgi:DNA-directed RNA polymerase subunit RPC12/RpoP